MAEKIYCPRCSTECLADASYCRTCGLDLSEIGALVRGNSQNSHPDRFRPNRDIMRLGMGLFILGLVVALGNAAIKSLNLFPSEWGKMVFLLLIMLGMACLGIGLVVPARRRSRSKNKKDPQMKGPSATNRLPSGRLFTADAVFPAATREPAMSEPGSVTELTTRNLQSTKLK
jgi:hypothetical protein